jgi:acyl-coenzyme A thioesterase PaaI-like protein
MFDKNKPHLNASQAINPIGLKLEFSYDGKTARTEFKLNENHQGSDKHVHQGILIMLMDEGMGWIARHGAGVDSVSAKLDVEFHTVAKTGELLIMTSYITKKNKRLLEAEARIESNNGVLVAEGYCLQYIMGLADYVKNASGNNPE